MKLRLVSAALLLVSQAHAQTSPPATGSSPPATSSAPPPVTDAAPPSATEPPPSAADSDVAAPTPAPPPTPAPAAAPAPVVEEEPRKSSKIYDRLEVGGFLGWGIQLDGQEDKPYGFNLGLRAGAVLPNHLYAGLSLGIFAGQSDVDYGYYTVSLWQSQFGLEGGYDFDFGPLTLRPYLGLGINRKIVSVSSPYGSYAGELGSTTDLYANLGGMGHIKLTDRVYGGLDTRLNLVTSGPAGLAFVLAASGGVMF